MFTFIAGFVVGGATLWFFTHNPTARLQSLEDWFKSKIG